MAKFENMRLFARTITGKLTEAYTALGVFIFGLIVIEWAVFAGSDEGFIPREVCWQHNPRLIWLQVGSNALIALSYFSIPYNLAQIARLNKKHSFNKILWCFAGFIVLCGATHVMEVVLVWTPVYWIDGAVRFATAIFSLLTAFYTRTLYRRLPPLPDVLKMVESYRHLEERIARLRSSYPHDREFAEESLAADKFDELRSELKRAINFVSTTRGDGLALPEVDR